MKSKNKFILDNNAFTLIELLAVIIILAVLLIIAIPSVSNYINDSRKNVYITTAKEHISGAMHLVNTGKLEMYDTSATYYIPGHCVKMETDTQSPYGNWKERYVGVIFTGKGWKYYWTSTDASQVGVLLTPYENLDIDKIETGIEDVFPNASIEGREKILVLGDNCLPGGWIEKTNESTTSSGNGTIKIDNNTWEKESLRIKIEQGYCWNVGYDKICNINFSFTNTGSVVITNWEASFTLPNGASLYSNSIGDFATLSFNGNKVYITSTDKYWNFLQPGDTVEKNSAIQVRIPKNIDFDLDDGMLEYVLISDESQSGTTTGGVLGDASDMNIDLAMINVELKRTNYWGSGGNYFAQYDIIITNISEVDISDWSFTLIFPDEIKGITPYNIDVTTNGSSNLITPTQWSSAKAIEAGKSATISSAFMFSMSDVNAIPNIE